MERRSFIGTILAALGLGTVAKAAESKSITFPVTDSKVREMQQLGRGIVKVGTPEHPATASDLAEVQAKLNKELNFMMAPNETFTTSSGTTYYYESNQFESNVEKKEEGFYTLREAEFVGVKTIFVEAEPGTHMIEVNPGIQVEVMIRRFTPGAAYVTYGIEPVVHPARESRAEWTRSAEVTGVPTFDPERVGGGVDFNVKSACEASVNSTYKPIKAEDSLCLVIRRKGDPEIGIVVMRMPTRTLV